MLLLLLLMFNGLFKFLIGFSNLFKLDIVVKVFFLDILGIDFIVKIDLIDLLFFVVSFLIIVFNLFRLIL